MEKLVLIILLPVVLLPAVYSYYNYALNLPNSSNETPVSFTVEAGQSVEEITKNLEQEGLIRSPALFQLYVALSHLSSRLQAGEYEIPQNLNLQELLALLQHGTFEEKLTFIEGWRREEIAEEINSKSSATAPNLSATEFLKESEGLEGYLFPDTYFISKETTAENLVQMMRENFDKKVGQPKLSELSLGEVINIASIVEREVRFTEDKPVVAGILVKRLKNGWLLQADATIQYALGFQEEAKGWWKKTLSSEDLEVDSPYNTYKNPGLPPTPICNPGLDSLRAVLEPRETDYWYYVSDSEGRMRFAVTNEEHNGNVSKYVR